MTLIYEIRSEFGESSSRNLAAQNIKFQRDFGQLRNLIANISGTQKDIVNRKTALQTTDTPAHAKLRPNTVYFGPQTAKNRTGVLNDPSAIVQKTGVNKSVAFARGQHAFQRAAITLGTARIYFLQGVSIAYYAEPCISYDRVLRPSLRLSVTCWH